MLERVWERGDIYKANYEGAPPVFLAVALLLPIYCSRALPEYCALLSALPAAWECGAWRHRMPCGTEAPFVASLPG